jgi:hypothetical protein
MFGTIKWTFSGVILGDDIVFIGVDINLKALRIWCGVGGIDGGFLK